MLMRFGMQNDYDEKNEILFKNSNALSIENFVPLSQREEMQSDTILEGIGKLKRNLLEKEFESYIENILSLKLINNFLWLITDSAMHRSILEHKFVPAFKTAFAVQNVRIISQAV